MHKAALKNKELAQNVNCANFEKLYSRARLPLDLPLPIFSVTLGEVLSLYASVKFFFISKIN